MGHDLKGMEGKGCVERGAKGQHGGQGVDGDVKARLRLYCVPSLVMVIYNADLFVLSRIKFFHLFSRNAFTLFGAMNTHTALVE